MTVQRFDSGGKLGQVQRTPQGGIRVPAALARTGVLTYSNPDGSPRREYRSPEEVGRADSLATLRDAPVTNLHHGLITPANFRAAAVGALSGEARLDGALVQAELVIQDQRTIDQIERGERSEVSAGYTCKLVREPGVSPTGERYDAKQVDIVYNHVALVPRGRAGREVALRLDAADNQITGELMKIEIVNGVEYEIGTDAHRAAVAMREDAERKTRTRLDAADALATENATLKAKIAQSERAALVAVATARTVTVREDMDADAIMRAVIAKLAPSVDLTGKSAEFVSAAYEIAIAAPVAGSNAAAVREDAERARTGQAREDAAPTEAPDVIARRAMIKRQREGARAHAEKTLDKR